MPHLVGLVEDMLGKSIGFRSLQDGAIDTTTASGELMFNIFSSLAQFERRLIQERTHAGLAAARARGRLGGRKPVRADDPRVVTAKRLHKDRSLSIDQICAMLGISRPTFYRYLGPCATFGRNDRDSTMQSLRRGAVRTGSLRYAAAATALEHRSDRLLIRTFERGRPSCTHSKVIRQLLP